MPDLLVPIAGSLVPVDLDNAGLLAQLAAQVALLSPPTPVVLTASEAIAPGDFCNIFASSGAKLRKADASDDTRPCDCFAPAAIASAASGEVKMPGTVISGLSGLTAGADYWLSETGGLITTVPPSTAGNLVQRIGKALSATQLFFNPREGTTL